MCCWSPRRTRSVCARVVRKATLAGDGFLYAVDRRCGVAWYGFRLGVAIGEDVEALLTTEAEPDGYGLAGLGLVEGGQVVYRLIETVKVRHRRQEVATSLPVFVNLSNDIAVVVDVVGVDDFLARVGKDKAVEVLHHPSL